MCRSLVPPYHTLNLIQRRPPNFQLQYQLGIRKSIRARTRAKDFLPPFESKLPILILDSHLHRLAPPPPSAQPYLLILNSFSQPPEARRRSRHTTPSKMPPRRIAVQPARRTQPKGFFGSLYHNLTSEENASVVISVAMFGVSNSRLAPSDDGKAIFSSRRTRGGLEAGI